MTTRLPSHSRSLVLALALVAAGLPHGVRAQGVEIEDRLDVIQVDRRLIAVNADRSLPEIELEIGERVLDKKSGGLVGVVLTSARLLGITARNASWRELRYQIAERASAPDRILLGDRVAMVTLPNRLAALAPGGTGWNELNIGPREDIRRSVVDSNLAGVVTPRRAIAFARQSGFVAIPLLPQERIEASSVEESSWVLTTSERVLIFRIGAQRWVEQRRIRR